MSTTQINLDDDALAEAARILGTSSKVGTVNAALRAVVVHHQQRVSIERAAARGTFAGAPVGDEAWR